MSRPDAPPLAGVVRQAQLEGLRRRLAQAEAAKLPATVRERLAQRVRAVESALGAGVAGGDPERLGAVETKQQAPGALAELTTRLAPSAALPIDQTVARATVAEATIPCATPSAGPTPLPELQTLRHQRADLQRLKARRQVQRARARVPAQAGPLNTHHLLHQALAALQADAPELLERIDAQMEVLVGLERVFKVG